MELAVITFTNKRRGRWLEETKQSVYKFLPATAEHLILNCEKPEHLEPMRLECVGIAKYITFVDDDDTIIKDSLNTCLDLLNKTNFGVAFTDEQKIDSDSKIIFPDEKIRTGLTTRCVAMHPNIVHHLAMIRSDAVPKEIISEALKLGRGAEWLIKASAGLTNKAIHVKDFGYQWRQHGDNFHKTKEWTENYKTKMNDLVLCLSKYSNFINRILPFYKDGNIQGLY